MQIARFFRLWESTSTIIVYRLQHNRFTEARLDHLENTGRRMTWLVSHYLHYLHYLCYYLHYFTPMSCRMKKRKNSLRNLVEQFTQPIRFQGLSCLITIRGRREALKRILCRSLPCAILLRAPVLLTWTIRKMTSSQLWLASSLNQSGLEPRFPTNGAWKKRVVRRFCIDLYPV